MKAAPRSTEATGRGPAARRDDVPAAAFASCDAALQLRNLQKHFEKSRDDTAWRVEHLLARIEDPRMRRDLREAILDFAERCVAAGSVKERKGR
jgi:hypothetical protein